MLVYVKDVKVILKLNLAYPPFKLNAFDSTGTFIICISSFLPARPKTFDPVKISKENFPSFQTSCWEISFVFYV